MAHSAHYSAVHSAAYYESRAEEVRTIAEMMTDPWCRKVLLAVADDYVRLAGDQLSDDAARQRRISRLGAH